MSRRNNSGKDHELDLNLNLSLPTRRAETTPADEEYSSPSSCLSSEIEIEQGGFRSLNSPETTSMVLAACPRCLMYVMLSEEDPKCPKCRRPVLLDFLRGAATTTKSG